MRAWPAFLRQRQQRLAQQDRYGAAAEKVAEGILEDLFTQVLDWPVSALNFQVGYADLLLTSLSVKCLVVEVKRPGALVWNRRAVQAALDQACRYAAEQRVRSVAVSDGELLYAADVVNGGLRDRVAVRLREPQAPTQLWWLSQHGIYRPVDPAPAGLPPAEPAPEVPPASDPDGVVHPKYRLPARCFGYVGRADDPRTWKLPYRGADGSVDARRLPKAIGSILTNYRGLKVGGIPDQAVPDVLVRLARAACELGRMPHQCADPGDLYRQLRDALEQFDRLADIAAPQ